MVENIYNNILELSNIYESLTGCDGMINQNLNEVAEVVDYLKNYRFNNFVEIGTNRAGSLFLYGSTLIKDKGSITSFDIDSHPAQKIIIDYLNKKYKATFICGLASSFSNKYNNIDLLHIDGWHEYDFVKNDFSLWYPKVVSGGVVLLHDTMLHEGCINFLKDIKKQIPNIKTFHAGDKNPGISVLIKE